MSCAKSQPVPAVMAIRERADMQRVNEYNFYELAIHVHKLTELDSDVKVKYNSVFFNLYQARAIINKMLTLRPLNVTLSAATELGSAITAIVPTDWPQAVGKLQSKNEDVPHWQFYAVAEAAKKFETVLAAECQVLDTYFVSKKGAYSTVDLVERAHTVFGPLISRLPEQARRDFDHAGKSLAFDLPTASAFHSMRGTETVIRKYYEVVVGKPPKQRMRNWHAYIKILTEHKADDRVTAFLDHIRETYRNPVLHPEEIVDEDQALILFGTAVSVVSLMIREIDRLTAKSAQPLQFPATQAITQTGSGT